MEMQKDYTRFSFIDLLKKHEYTIEIPIIQRDYAQGRKSQKDVRDSFLEALKDYLDEGKANRDLDFVYGYTELNGSGSKFIPLDGQQRLTTLFLLHWYLANISGNIDSFRTLLQKNRKSRFTYKTRFSSAEFCDTLLINNVDLLSLLKNDEDKVNALSKTIKNKSWFFDAWKADPTIQSMLTMLDSIHAKFIDCTDYYDRLVDEHNPIVTFLFLDLKDLQQNDDLYIKMNARGKPLTEFENFKAKLEQTIEDQFKDDKATYTLSIDGNQVEWSLKNYFSFKIDAVWSNTFWKFRSLGGKPNSYDDEMMNFIRVLIANSLAAGGSIDTHHIDILFKKESISFRTFMKMGALNKEVILSIKDSFDILCRNGDDIPRLIEDSFYYNEKEIFEKVLLNNTSYPERIMFYAYMQYLHKYSSDISGLQDWIRVIHNLVQNSRIEGLEAAISALKAIDILLPFAPSILNYLSNKNGKVDFFFTGQVLEERLKARLFIKFNHWKKLILQAEQESFHKGQIAYLFEFSGVLSKWLEDKNLTYEPDTDKRLMSAFNKYREKSQYLFSILDSTLNAEYLLERALLTKGNYLIPASNDRFNFGSSKNTANYDRDYSWKRLLRYDNAAEENDSITWVKRRKFVKLLMDDSRLKTGTIDNNLKQIIDDNVEGWRSYFINNPMLIQYCKQGFIYTTNWEDIQLLNASQMNHLRFDMITYDMCLAASEKWMDKLLPFGSDQITNSHAKGREDESYFSLNNWCYKRINYSIDVKHEYDYEKEKGVYYLFLKKAKGDKRSEYYAEEVRLIMNNESFTWDDEGENEFYFSSKSKDVMIKKLFTICKRFRELEE